jgi:histidine triad (HIT) family protein
MSTEPSIFTRIINREIPAEIIYEDALCIVIPDKYPSMPGQLLVIPKVQIAYLADLDETTFAHTMALVKRCMTALDRALGTIRTCVIIEGFEVPHVHVRLYPCHTTELLLDNRQEASDADLVVLATALRPHLL